MGVAAALVTMGEGSGPGRGRAEIFVFWAMVMPGIMEEGDASIRRLLEYSMYYIAAPGFWENRPTLSCLSQSRQG